jgi:predicted ABC-type ATPase
LADASNDARLGDDQRGETESDADRSSDQSSGSALTDGRPPTDQRNDDPRAESQSQTDLRNDDRRDDGQRTDDLQGTDRRDDPQDNGGQRTDDLRDTDRRDDPQDNGGQRTDDLQNTDRRDEEPRDDSQTDEPLASDQRLDGRPTDHRAHEKTAANRRDLDATDDRRENRDDGSRGTDRTINDDQRAEDQQPSDDQWPATDQRDQDRTGQNDTDRDSDQNTPRTDGQEIDDQRYASDPSHDRTDEQRGKDESTNTPQADQNEFVLEDWHSRFPTTLDADDPLLRSTHLIDTEARREFRDKVVQDALAKAEPVTGRKPIMYLMGGGGASGKGTLLKRLWRDGVVPRDNVVHLDPDEIKLEIPEYNEIVALKDSRAAAVAHEESSDLGKRILGGALDKNVDLIYDVTLGDPRKAIDMIARAKAEGYEIRLYGVSANAGRAVEWNVDRAKKSGRWVPIKMQLTAHRGFSRGFPAYADLVDRAELYDTNGDDGPRLMAIKAPGRELEVVDDDMYETFLHKGDINTDAAGVTDMYAGPPHIEAPAVAPDRDHYVDDAMANLGRTSRTAAGTIDVSASPNKADQMAADLSGDRAAQLAQDNYRSVIGSLYDNRATSFADPTELRGFIEGLVTRVNSGILRDGVLYRAEDSPKYPSYTSAASLPEAAGRFFDQLHHRLSDPDADPVETAAWVEYRMDLTDHLWADGCGKSAKAVAAWVLMRSGYDLPNYPADRAAQFRFAPRFPSSTGDGMDAVQFRDWLDYYRTLFGDQG